MPLALFSYWWYKSKLIGLFACWVIELNVLFRKYGWTRHKHSSSGLFPLPFLIPYLSLSSLFTAVLLAVSAFWCALSALFFVCFVFLASFRESQCLHLVLRRKPACSLYHDDRLHRLPASTEPGSFAVRRGVSWRCSQTLIPTEERVKLNNRFQSLNLFSNAQLSCFFLLTWNVISVYKISWHNGWCCQEVSVGPAWPWSQESCCWRSCTP